MVQINLNTDSLPKEERDLRVYFRSLKPSTSVPMNVDGTYDIGWTLKYEDIPDRKVKLKLKRTGFDDKGNIDGFFVEEDMRKKFFYPHLPRLFFDVGAAHGAWSLPALAMDCHVIAFEIDPRYMTSLLKSVGANPGFKERLHTISEGLYSTSCLGNIFELEHVEFTTIDHFVKNTEKIPQYIKIDVEGLEFEVLKGARRTIDLFHPMLFIELHLPKEVSKETRRSELLDILSPFKYEMHEGRKDERFEYFFFS